MENRVKPITAQDFDEEVTTSDKPVLVDFYADWCGPCRVLGPVMAELADEYAGRLEVRKVDVDANPELAGRVGVRSIPTLVLFKDGSAKDVVVGAQSKAKLSEVIERYA